MRFPRPPDAHRPLAHACGVLAVIPGCVDIEDRHRPERLRRIEPDEVLLVLHGALDRLARLLRRSTRARKRCRGRPGARSPIESPVATACPDAERHRHRPSVGGRPRNAGRCIRARALRRRGPSSPATPRCSDGQDRLLPPRARHTRCTGPSSSSLSLQGTRRTLPQTPRAINERTSERPFTT